MVQSTINETENKNSQHYGCDNHEDTTSLSRSDSSDDESPGLDVFSDEEELQEQEKKVNENDRGFLEKDCGSMTVRALVGLGIAGLGGSLIGDVYGMFYVDCFLRAYKLPMRVFGIGSAIFAVIHTANDVAGAYFLDSYCSGSKQKKKREDLVGLSGCLFALSLLGPFFRWGPRAKNENSGTGSFWDGLHFVGTLSIYDTMFSFNCILQGSIVSDNHSMTENQRIAYFALRDMVGILAPLVVTKIGLSLFDISNLRNFRVYVVALVLVSSLLCVWAQSLIHKTNDNKSTPIPGIANKLLPTFLRNMNSSSGYAKVNRDASQKSNGSSNSEVESANAINEPGLEIVESSSNNGKLNFWKALKDFAAHPNFRYWIGMEMLMEGQNTFMGNFQKTFVDQLLRNENGASSDGGWSDAACDWMLALVDPCTQIVGLLLFIPIKRYGYASLYKVVFVTNVIMASALLLSNGLNNGSGDDNNSILPIAAFLFFSNVLSNAMAGAGFGLAMCDMVLEMKHSHSVVQQRKNPPSLAGLFMGVNALFCKPAESILPIIAASFLGDGYNNDEDSDFDNESSGIASAESKLVLYRLLVLPPLVCSVLQLAVWSRYSLYPKKAEQLRTELKEYEYKKRRQRQAVREDSLNGSDRSYTDANDDNDIIEMNKLG